MRQPLHLRLRPFLRRDLRARFISALAAVLVLSGLSWLGISALSKIDSAEAHALRVELGLEHPWAVCGGPDHPTCNYDDRYQEKVDRKFAHERQLRVAVLEELLSRTDLAMGQLDEAEDLLRNMKTNDKTGALEGDTVALREALAESLVDLSPAPITDVETRRANLLGTFEGRDVRVVDEQGKPGWVGQRPRHAVVMGDQLIREIRSERNRLRTVAGRIQMLRSRDGLDDQQQERATTNRFDLVDELKPRGAEPPATFARRLETAGWLSVRARVSWLVDDAAADRNSALVANPAAVMVAPGLPEVDATLARLARYDLEELHELISDPTHIMWAGGWVDADVREHPVAKPVARYHSPVDDGARWRMLGAAAFLFASVMLIVVGPVVTATTTAREREAGTLPVLRMTGLSAGDLAFAMAVGPNVFALVSGLSLLAFGSLALMFTVGPMALLGPLALLAALSVGTHLTAIGLGDALGQRVNAMVVGGLLALALLGPGLIGAVMVVGDMASTGLLLGPLPAVAGTVSDLAGLKFGRLAMAGDFGATILGYTVAAQGLLGGLCLLSWRRRVEQAWAPLFRPLEGAILALASVGCSALAVLDLSGRLNVQTYDQVNLVTAVATAFLMPVLGWLLVSSLVRPARASAMAGVSEVRRGFLRFQVFIVLTFAALAGSYMMVLHETGLDGEKAEVMWATLAQGLLVAETAAATLLWSSRRRDGKHRVLILGTAVTVVQLVFAIAVYNLEVQHVALTQAAGFPFLMGMEASPYWIAFMVVLWGAGLGLVMAALLRDKDKGEAPSDHEADANADEDSPPRYLH